MLAYDSYHCGDGLTLLPSAANISFHCCTWLSGTAKKSLDWGVRLRSILLRMLNVNLWRWASRPSRHLSFDTWVQLSCRRINVQHASGILQRDFYLGKEEGLLIYARREEEEEKEEFSS